MWAANRDGNAMKRTWTPAFIGMLVIGSYAIGALRDAVSIAVLYRYSIIYPLILLALLILLRVLTQTAPTDSAIAGRS